MPYLPPDPNPPTAPPQSRVTTVPPPPAATPFVCTCNGQTVRPDVFPLCFPGSSDPRCPPSAAGAVLAVPCFPGSADPRCPPVPSGAASYLPPPNCFPGSTDTRCNGFTEGNNGQPVGQGSAPVPHYHVFVPADQLHRVKREAAAEPPPPPPRTARHAVPDKQPEQEVISLRLGVRGLRVGQQRPQPEHERARRAAEPAATPARSAAPAAPAAAPAQNASPDGVVGAPFLVVAAALVLATLSVGALVWRSRERRQPSLLVL